MIDPKKNYFFFDYISPYSYIASELIARDPELAARLEYTPVVFGTILSHRGVKGPGEIPIERRVGLMDNLMLAEMHGIPFEAPLRHPFNPLYALRSTIAVADPEKRRLLTHAYFRLAWRDTHSLEDLEVLKKGLAEAGVEQDPEAAASDAGARKALKESTKAALERGVTGVPSILVEGDVVFFGGDRLDMFRRYLKGEVRLDRPRLEKLLERQGATRVT